MLRFTTANEVDNNFRLLNRKFEESNAYKGVQKFDVGIDFDFIEKLFATSYFGYQDIISEIGGVIGFILPFLSLTLMPLTGLLFIVMFAKYYLVNF